MAILKIKQILDDLKDGTHVAVPDSTANLAVTKASSAGYSGTSLLSSTATLATSAANAGTSLKATSAAYAGTSRIAHYGSAGTGALT